MGPRVPFPAITPCGPTSSTPASASACAARKRFERGGGFVGSRLAQVGFQLVAEAQQHPLADRVVALPQGVRRDDGEPDEGHTQDGGGDDRYGEQEAERGRSHRGSL